MGVKISMSVGENRLDGLTYFFGLDAELEVEAYSVRQILHTIIGQHPDRWRLLTEEGELRRFVAVAINDEYNPQDALDRPLIDGDEVIIIPAICTLFFQLIQRDFMHLNK